MVLSSNLVAIGRYAFQDCSGLREIEIPNGVTNIGLSAFRYCRTLTSVALPNGLQTLGNYAFSGCSNVVTVAMPPRFTAKGAFPGAYERITSVTLPDDATEICASAFEGCASLGSLKLPSNLTVIGPKAFKGCSGITDLQIPPEVVVIGEESFMRCTGLTSLSFPESVSEIGSKAFSGCEGLADVTFSEGLRIIGSRAFDDCLGLTSVVLPESVESVGSKAFAGCREIVSVAVPANVVLKDVFPASYAKIVSVKLPDDTMEIRASAFEGCKSIVAFQMPVLVSAIGEKAFSGCSGLTDVTFPKGLCVLGAQAFAGCQGLTSVILPESVESVGSKAFAGCKGVVSVAVPANVVLKEVFPDSYATITSATLLPGATEIAENVFKGCQKIDSVKVLEGVTSIGKEAFSGCGDLREVVLPSSLLDVGKKAFHNCRKIVSVTSPARFRVRDVFVSSYESVTSVTIPPDSGDVGARAYYGCASLASITLQSMTPPALSEEALLGVEEHVRIVVPNGSIAAYSASPDWGGYLRQIEADGEYPIIYALHRGENAEGNPLSYRTDQLPLKLGEPVKAGCAFHGWLLNGERVGEIPAGTTGCISLTASWRIAEPADPPMADYVTTKAQYDGIVWDAEANRLIGVLRLKSTKMNDRTRTVKISGYLLGLDGKKKTVKQSAKSLTVPGTGPLTADFTVKGIGQMRLVIGGDMIAGALEGYHVRTGAVGGNWVQEDAAANADLHGFAGMLGEVQMRLLPADEPVLPKRGKWAFNKAAAVSWKKPKGGDVKCLVVDTSRGKTNLSAIKLSYTPKTGGFKGSFRIVSIESKSGGKSPVKKLKKYTVKVTGIVIDGVGYGKAVVKKPANEWTLSVD